MPTTVWRRRFPSQDIEIAVIRANFVKGILWAVPLIQYVFNQVLATLKSKTKRSFVRLPIGGAVYF